MKLQTLSLTILCIVSLQVSFAQTSGDPIEIQKNRFFQNGQRLAMPQLLEITKPNDAAYAEMKKAQTNSVVGAVFGGVGGFLIGFPLGTAIGGGDPNWAMAGIGAVVVAIGIPFSVSGTKHAKEGVSIYNEGLKSTSFMRPEIEFGLTNNGLGLALRF